MMQRDADIAAVFSIGRRDGVACVGDDCRLGAARGRRQGMVMPAEQDSLEEDGDDAEQRGPAPCGGYPS